VKLKVFLYLLMLDTTVPGEVERIVAMAEKNADPKFLNAHLAAYAEELSKRLLGQEG